MVQLVGAHELVLLQPDDDIELRPHPPGGLHCTGWCIGALRVWREYSASKKDS